MLLRIEYPARFYKIDINASELSALKEHTYDDFINILIYLSEIFSDYKFAIGHYSIDKSETVFYVIPKEINLKMQ